MLEELIKAARGEQEADLVLKNGKIINVFSHEIIEGDIAVYKGRIAGIGSNYKGKKEVDLKGAYAAPGFIEGHIHVESSMVTVPEFAKAVSVRGTTTAVIDPHEITNVMGTEGIRYMFKSAKYNPLSVYVMLPSCVPATNMETSGAELKAIDLLPLLSDRWVLGLGEVMDYPGVVFGNKDVVDKLKIAHSENKKIDGHAPGLSGMQLNAYLAAGVKSDHECVTSQEAEEKLKMGMHIMIREGSATKNLKDLVPIINCYNEDRISFVTDDKNPKDLHREGHLDHTLRLAVKHGVDPISAVKMVSINTANYFGLKNKGAVAPGFEADIVILEDLKDFKVLKVYQQGRLAAENGKMIYENENISIPPLRSSINIPRLNLEHFQIEAESDKVNVIEVVPDQIITKKAVGKAVIKDGKAYSNIQDDILKLFVIERHLGTGNIGKGFVKGLKLKKGAMATSIAHDSHNIIAVGTDDESILEAVIEIARMKGGMCVYADGEVKAALPLPIAGLMSDKPLAEVIEGVEKVHNAAAEIGCPLSDPFITLSFLALPVIPSIKLTDKGLVDVSKFDFIDLFIK